MWFQCVSCCLVSFTLLSIDFTEGVNMTVKSSGFEDF